MSTNTHKSLCVDEWGAGLRFGAKALNTNSVKRAKTPAEVLPVCLAHNLRQSNHDHRHRGRMDPGRAHLNVVLAGPADLGVAVAIVNDTLDALGLAPKRRDAIMGVELVFQPPYGVDLGTFWAVCLDWARARFEHVVSAVVHHDQKRPHMHALALAVRDGKLAGNELTASPNRPMQRRADFMAYMRRTLGLRPDRKVKTLAELAASTGKGAKTKAEAERRDAALLHASQMGMGVSGLGGSAPAKSNPHSPHEKGNPLIAQLSRQQKEHLLWALIRDLNVTPDTPLESPQQATQSTEQSEQMRVREDAMPAEWWDADAGEFKPCTEPHKPIKAAAQAWVSAALRNVKRTPTTALCKQ